MLREVPGHGRLQVLEPGKGADMHLCRNTRQAVHHMFTCIHAPNVRRARPTWESLHASTETHPCMLQLRACLHSLDLAGQKHLLGQEKRVWASESVQQARPTDEISDGSRAANCGLKMPCRTPYYEPTMPCRRRTANCGLTMPCSIAL